MAREKAQAQEFAEKLKDITVELKAKPGNGGRLFGSITSQEVADALKQQSGIAIDKKKIVQDEPIKSFAPSASRPSWAMRSWLPLRFMSARPEQFDLSPRIFPGSGAHFPAIWCGRCRYVLQEVKHHG